MYEGFMNESSESIFLYQGFIFYENESINQVGQFFLFEDCVATERTLKNVEGTMSNRASVQNRSESLFAYEILC